MEGTCRSIIAPSQARSRWVATALLAMFTAAVMVGITSCGSDSQAGAQPPPSAAPVTAVDSSRVSNPRTGFASNADFTRVFFTNKALPITNIGRADKVYQGKLIQARAFMSATILYRPPRSVIDNAHFVGSDDPGPGTYDLVAMRCSPSDPGQLQPLMATWPNLFKAATSDLADLMAYTPADCPTPSLDSTYSVDQRLYCSAQAFSDSPSTMVPVVLQHAVHAGATIFRMTGTPFLPTGSSKGADVLYDLYGIGAGFSGLGYSVKNSYLVSQGGNIALTASQSLEQSVVTEYVVLNVPLKDANCRCVRVSPYANRDASLLDWDHVWAAGQLDPGDGHCVARASLP